MLFVGDEDQLLFIALVGRGNLITFATKQRTQFIRNDLCMSIFVEKQNL